MDVLNEVEDLFKKLESVSVDIREAAFRKIIEKIASAEPKKMKDISTPRRRPSKRRIKVESGEQKVDPHAFGSELHETEYVIENILTSRGRKAQRICCAQTKPYNMLNLQKRGSYDAQNNIATLIKKSCVADDKFRLPNENLAISEKFDEHVISNVSSKVDVTNESVVMHIGACVEDLGEDLKLENSFEESQLVIIDPANARENVGDKNYRRQETIANANSASTSEKAADTVVSRLSGEIKTASVEETLGTKENSSREKKSILSCDGCSFHTTNKILLENHKRKHMVTRPHKCHDCGKSFHQASALRVHMKRHRGQRDFPCDYGCSYRAYTKGDKVRHMTLHTGERCHQCQYCGKAFAKDSTLREHVKSIHERSSKHICATCGFSTFRANNLRVHISMRHRGEFNNHVCPVCGAKVKQRAAFLDHMRSHTGERPYKCSVPVCGRSFTCVARLTVHQKAVHGPREFKCKHCQKSFQTKHHMERHELIHTNQKPFACPFCSYSCNTQGNVTKHVKGVHNKPDFSYRKYKADQQVDSDCKALKSEWIEKGEKLTTEYLKDLSKKIGREVTLSELREREAEKNRRVTEDVESVKKRRSRKLEHDYHSKINPEEDRLEEEEEEEEADEPPVLLSVAPVPADTSSCNVSGMGGVGDNLPSLPQTHMLQGMTLNRNPNAQPTLFIQTTRETDIGHLQSVLSDKFQKGSNSDSSLVSGQNIQFCMNEQRMPLEDQIPLHVVYHSTPSQLSNSTSQESTDLNSSKYINNFNFVEVKEDAASSQTVVVIINTDNH